MINKLLFIIFMFSTLMGGYGIAFVCPIVLYIKFIVFIKRKWRIKKEYIYILTLYFMIILMGCISNLIHFTSIYNLIIYILLNSTFIIFPLVFPFNGKDDKFIKGFNFFYNFQIFIVFTQIINLIIKYKSINIFKVSMASGDFLKGTFSNSSLTCIFFCMVSFVYFDWYCKTRKSSYIYKVLISIIIIILTSANAHIIIFGITIFLSTIINMINKRKIKQIGIFFVVIYIIINVYSFTQPSNVMYIKNITRSIFIDDSIKPRKIDYIMESVIQLPKESWEISLIGVGGGNYSSRAAMITSNEYLSGISFSFPSKSISEFSNKYILPKWNKELLSKGYNEGIANQPFSSVISIFAETGIIGVVLFISILYRIYKIEVKKSSRYNNLVGQFSIFFTLILFIDNYLEYGTFIAIFWVCLEAFNGYDLYLEKMIDKE